MSSQVGLYLHLTRVLVSDISGSNMYYVAYTNRALFMYIILPSPPEASIVTWILCSWCGKPSLLVMNRQ